MNEVLLPGERGCARAERPWLKRASGGPRLGRRFVASLPPPPAASPHQRRAEALQRLHAAEMSAERALVATLTLPDDGAEDGAVAA